MRAFQKFEGGAIYSTREYDIATSTEIEEGEVVKISAGLVVSAATTESGAILGIAAENHKGSADALNPRANGTRIKVYDDPSLVMACVAPTFKAIAGGSATTVLTDDLGGYAADDFNGGKLVLIAKASGSTNTDPIGTVKDITDFAYASGTSTFTVTSGGTAYVDDEYALFPPTGLAKGALDSNILKWVATGVSCTSLKVVGRCEETGEVLLKAASHF